VELFKVGSHRIIHVPVGWGEELRLHLEAHGIHAAVSSVAEAPFDRLELQPEADTEAVQAILDHWEKGPTLPGRKGHP
jgi:hypothetical protein